MSTPRIKAKLAGKSLEVPLYRDMRATQKLIERLNQRLKEIETSSGRIDTQAFALEAAYTFAAEAQRLLDDAEAERHETVKELDRLSKAIDKLVREFKLDT
jgi:cell division protein ZapA (FtsZ GTPase activity inhibitor)